MNTEATETSLKKYTLITAIMSSFITPFLGAAINVSLPSIGDEFHMTSILLSWVATIFLLSTVIFLVPTGRIADIYGRKKIYFIGAITATLGCLAGLFAYNTEMLLLSRAIQGAGSAMIFGTSNAILISVYPKKERGKALGMVVASVYLGGSLGPVLGGILVEQFGWRSIFLLSFIILNIVSVIIKLKIRNEWIESRNEPYDIKGTILFVSSIFCLMYGLSIMPGTYALALVIIGILLLYLFVKLEQKHPYPLFQIKLFLNNPVFAMSSLAALLNYSASFGIGFLLSLYFQYIRNMTPQETGLIMFAQPIVMALTSPYAGKLSDKYEPRFIVSLGMSLSLLGLLMLTFISSTTSTIYLVICLIILGLGFGLFSSPNTNAVLSSVEKKYLGLASSTVGTMRLIGQMTSMGIIMTIFSVVIGRVKILPHLYPQFLQSIKVAFVVFAFLCTVGIWASLKRGNLTR